MRLRFELPRITAARLLELLPVVIPLALLPWIISYAPRYVAQPMFRDPGMFQLMAWCMRQGQALYDDVATPNGPLIYVIHALIQIIAGARDTN